METLEEVEPDAWEFAADVDYWAWYPSDESLWSRSDESFDFRVDDRRWMAWPTEGGSVRCRVENDEAPGNAGFYFDIGPIGGIQSVTIDSETVESDGGDQKLLFAIYLDASGDGEYFEWEAAEDREAFADLGGDVEGFGLFPAGGTVTIDNDTVMDVIPPIEERVTLGDLKAGVLDGVDESTEAAIQVSVVGSGQTNVEEVLIHEVTAETVSIYEPPAESWPMFAHDKFNGGNNRESYGPGESIHAHWEFATDGAVRSSPAVVDDSVFVGSDDGHIYAIDTRTGDQRWAVETGGPVRSSPAVFHDRVIVGSDDHVIYAIDIETGDVVWDFETGGRVRAPSLVDVHTELRVADHLVAVGSYDGVMYVFEPRTGELIHRQSADASITVSAVMIRWGGGWELIWGAEDSKRHYWIPSRREDQGQDQEPTYNLDAPHSAATAFTLPGTYELENGFVIYEVPGVLTRRIAGQLHHEWRFESDDEIHSSPALGQFVYVGSWDGNLYAIDRASGEPEWTFETGDRIDSSPAIAGDGVYVSSTDGHLYGLDTTSGELLGSFETGDAVHSSPAVAEGTVYVGSDDGNVYALTDE